MEPTAKAPNGFHPQWLGNTNTVIIFSSWLITPQRHWPAESISPTHVWINPPPHLWETQHHPTPPHPTTPSSWLSPRRQKSWLPHGRGFRSVCRLCKCYAGDCGMQESVSMATHPFHPSFSNDAARLLFYANVKALNNNRSWTVI